jgi:protein tyrosine phosphatase (PTP) superfamily phosphohydrolase (DUF442 family)
MIGALPASAQSPETELATVYNYLKISEDLTTTGQIAYDQIEAIKKAGFEVVVNLAPANEGANALEGFLVTQQGMSYVQIPVSWQEPSMRDLQMFFDVMETNKDRKVFVHCFANMRVSAFVYLYRTLMQNVPEAQALADLNEIWEPLELEQWAGLIQQAKQHHGSKP